MLRVLLSPRLVGLHLLALVATSVAVSLGLWQYDAWQTRRDAQAIDLTGAAAKPLATVMSPDDPFPGDAVGQPVTFTGTWLSQETFYVRNRMDERDGFWVVTPVAVPPGPAMLVVRGWSPTADSTPPARTGDVEVSGQLQPPQGSGAPDENVRDDVLPELRVASVVQRLDRDLYGAYVVSEDPTSGLAAVDPASMPQPSAFTALRNLLYAVEWWVFGGFAVFVWWRWCRDEVERAGQTEDTEVAEVASVR